jgi:hypothetical protein
MRAGHSEGLRLACSRTAKLGAVPRRQLLIPAVAARSTNGSLTLAAIPGRLGRLLSVTARDTFLPAHPSAETTLAARRGNRTTAA